MMASMAQNYSPHPGSMQPHPGMAQGHPMAGPHNPGQPGPGMPQQMHMGVSGPGPQVSQAGAMMGMPPGAGGPSQHALQHLNPAQAQQAQQIFQQQQQQMQFANPAMQQMQQHQHMLQHQQRQAARQAILAHQYSGVPGVPNGMSPMTPAQFQTMRGNPMTRTVNLPQHLQHQQQAVVEQNLHQQQQQQQAAHAQQQHQQQIMMQQQIAMQQQLQAGGNNQGQPTQMGQQQPNMQAQSAAMQQAHQQHQQVQQQQVQQQAAHAAAVSQAQTQGQAQAAQAQAQQAQLNPQAQAQQSQAGAVPQQPSQQQQQAVTAAMQQQMQQRQGEKFKGQCLMKLMQFGDHLSQFAVSSQPLSFYMANGASRVSAQAEKQAQDLAYWQEFVVRFFSPKGVLRHSLYIVDDTANKQYEITTPALPRYFYTHFESGVKNMQMTMEKGTEKELPNNGHYIESQKSSFVYWFDNGSQLVATGTLKAHFDAEQKIELLEFVTNSHEEYLPRSQVIDAARPLHEWSKEWRSLNSPPDSKQSPEMNKKKAKQMKSPAQPPPEIDLPESKVSKMGITPLVFRFLEIAEVIGQLNPLFEFSHRHEKLTPYTALNSYVTTVVAGAENGQQPNPTGPRTPGMANFPLGASPAQAHLQLPGGSPRVSGSPAQAPGMQHQQSQHGTSSSGPSANTSPNANNKRRRPSVKDEADIIVNGNPSKTAVKPSPRIGGKRQKGNPA